MIIILETLCDQYIGILYKQLVLKFQTFNSIRVSVIRVNVIFHIRKLLQNLARCGKSQTETSTCPGGTKIAYTYRKSDSQIVQFYQ